MENIKQEILDIIPKTAYHYDRVIFLENSNGLSYEGAADTFREFLVDNKIRHNVLYNIDSLSKENLIDVCKSCLDMLVVFETTGTSDNFKQLVEIFVHLTNNGYRFKFMECSVYDFKFYRLPELIGDGCISYHNLQCCGWSDMFEWSLTEIKK